MKRVLFLAPNYMYVRTTVAGVAKHLTRNNIAFTTNVEAYCVKKENYKDGDNLYLRTDDVEVIFIHDDPVEWTGAMLTKVDAVYGKKELVERCRERFYTSRAIVYRNGSLQKYIEAASSHIVDPTVCDDIPVKTQYIPEIKNVYFNNPVTVVIWADGTKTMIKCQSGDIYDEEVGLTMCIAKKALGNKGNFNNIFRKWIPKKALGNKGNFNNIFRKWIPNNETIMNDSAILGGNDND